MNSISPNLKSENSNSSIVLGRFSCLPPELFQGIFKFLFLHEMGRFIKTGSTVKEVCRFSRYVLPAECFGNKDAAKKLVPMPQELIELLEKYPDDYIAIPRASLFQLPPRYIEHIGDGTKSKILRVTSSLIWDIANYVTGDKVKKYTKEKGIKPLSKEEVDQLAGNLLSLLSVRNASERRAKLKTWREENQDYSECTVKRPPRLHLLSEKIQQKEKEESLPCEEIRWLVAIKGIIPGSCGRLFAEQQDLVTAFVDQDPLLEGFEMPKDPRDVLYLIYWYFLETQDKIFDGKAIRCSDMVGKEHLEAGWLNFGWSDNLLHACESREGDTEVATTIVKEFHA